MPKSHDERRREILDTARGLFMARGYEACTIHDVIDAVGIAKGTFYHYFRSKTDLLEELLDMIAQEILDRLDPIVRDRDRSAVDRLEAYFQQSLTVKAESPELMVVALRAIYSPENTLLRVGMFDRTARVIGPILTALIEEGVAAGEMQVTDPEICGDFLIRSLSVLSDRASRTLLSEGDAAALTAELHRIYDFMEWSIERLLGLPSGRITVADRSMADHLFRYVNQEAIS